MFFFFKQKTAYEVRISDWSSDVCSSDLFRGTGARANRGSDSRVIHFRDGDAYLDYQQQFGERAIYDVMTGHVQGVAKDIAAIEAFGPNPDHTFRMLRDRAYQQMVEVNPVEKGKVDNRARSEERRVGKEGGQTW